MMLSDPTGHRRAARIDYRMCMNQRYGHTVDDDRTDFLYAQDLDRNDASVDGGTPNAAWTRDVAAMQAVFAADADCRRPGYELAMRQVADVWVPTSSATAHSSTAFGPRGADASRTQPSYPGEVILTA